MVTGGGGLRGALAVRPVVKAIRRDPGCAMTLPLSSMVIYVKEILLKFRNVEATNQNAAQLVQEHESSKSYHVNELNPSRPNVNMHILLPVVYIFPMALVGRVCLNIKIFFGV